MKESMAKRRKNRRFFRSFFLAAALYVLLSAAATPVVLWIAFPRDDSGADGSFPLSGSQEITIPSANGFLQGWIAEAEDSRGVVLLLHGVHGNAGQMAENMALFREMGWTPLAINATGVGASDGAWTRGIQQQSIDGRAALAWISEQPALKGLPIVVYGHSAGAWAAARLSREDTVDGVICVSGFDRPVVLMTTWAEHYAGPAAWLEIPFLRMWESILFGPEYDASGEAALTESGKPALVVHGGADQTVPEETSLFAVCVQKQSPVETILAEKAGHSQSQVMEDVSRDAILHLLDASASYAPTEEEKVH